VIFLVLGGSVVVFWLYVFVAKTVRVAPLLADARWHAGRVARPAAAGAAIDARRREREMLPVGEASLPNTPQSYLDIRYYGE
jgi:hypothetical protein